ncbi:hypothetical protein EVAR_46166_1 [Eumeta japonica]|uniref:Uncharacterized protein n=1 Tax=Eumeta variegata TaxID=151549 RepID=A0A4C1Y2S6_EUMVA|nr:hypothetical protein EVAR_46166_1 [Eumeta japonica]
MYVNVLETLSRTKSMAHFALGGACSFEPRSVVSGSARVRVCGVPHSVNRAAAVKPRVSVPVTSSGYPAVCTPSPHTVSAPRSVRVGHTPCVRAHGLSIMEFWPSLAFARVEIHKKNAGGVVLRFQVQSFYDALRVNSVSQIGSRFMNVCCVKRLTLLRRGNRKRQSESECVALERMRVVYLLQASANVSNE